MKFSTLLLALLLPAIAPEDPLRCAPQEGLVLRKVFEREARLELTALEMTVDGGSHGEMPKPELSIELAESNTFLDRCAAVEDGRVTKLVRTFEKLSEERDERIVEGEASEQQTASAHSDLQGETVEFTWDSGEGEYSAEFEGGEGDSKLLEGLVAELDLCAFLPQGEVEEGASWDVPASAFGSLLCPGGDLKLVAEGQLEHGAELELARSLQGTIRATLRAADEQGLARIDLELELSARAERELEDDSGSERQSNAYQLSGELAWNSADGHFQSIELTGTVRSSIVTAREVEMGGRDFTTERSLEFAGDVTYRLRAEAP
jgi:hypothetical protein